MVQSSIRRYKICHILHASTISRFHDLVWQPSDFRALKGTFLLFCSSLSCIFFLLFRILASLDQKLNWILTLDSFTLVCFFLSCTCGDKAAYFVWIFCWESHAPTSLWSFLTATTRDYFVSFQIELWLEILSWRNMWPDYAFQQRWLEQYARLDQATLVISLADPCDKQHNPLCL